MSRILLIDDDFNLLQMVKLMLERVGHQVEISKDGERGLALAAQDQPDVAIIDVMMPGLSGYDVIRKLRTDPQTARIPIIILTARSQPMDKEMALEAGANAFLSKPVTAQELVDRVDAVLRAGVNYRVHTGLLTEAIPPHPAESAPETPSVPRPGPASAAPAAAQPPAPSPSKPARVPIGAEDVARPADVPPTRVSVVTVIGLRGGVGCTTVAVNLAFTLASPSRRVCLADFSTASGHVPLHMHLTPSQNWGSLLPLGDVPDPRMVGQLLAQHPSSGVAVLAAPPVPSAETLSTASAENVLRELASTFNPVVVDARSLDSAVQGALRVSSTVVAVMGDDPPSIQTTLQLLMALQKMQIEPERVRVVLNHVRPAIDVPAEMIQKALKRPLSAALPYEPGHISAIRRGVPLVQANPDSPFAKGIQQFSRTITM
ncbi:MAG TPA: response regulator [Aggregatilineaceae bacterium]|nr:response regulator [Aggregatilineaceae bacterium]